MKRNSRLTSDLFKLDDSFHASDRRKLPCLRVVSLVADLGYSYSEEEYIRTMSSILGIKDKRILRKEIELWIKELKQSQRTLNLTKMLLLIMTVVIVLFWTSLYLMM